MTEFFVGDVVKVEMPRGYSNRGVLGISLLYTTSPEARFNGATGTVSEIDPVGPYSVHQYLIDFRTHDNSRAGLPWQANWFRAEWLALLERAASGASGAGGIGEAAHSGARRAGGTVMATRPAGTTAMVPDANVTERGEGYLRVAGMLEAPDDFLIKGVDGSSRYYLISDDEYPQTPPDVCFADEATAQRLGYTRDGPSTTDQVIDPAAAGAGGFSTGEDSELAVQDAPASAGGDTGRTTFTEDDGPPTFSREEGYLDSPAVDQPTRDHAGEERGAGVVGPDATGNPAPTSSVDGASAPTAELNPRGVETAKLDPATISNGDEIGGASAGASGRSTGSVSGASTTAPSGPIGETELRTTPTGDGEAASDTAERYAAGKDPSADHDSPAQTQPLSRSGTSLLDPSRVDGFDEGLGGSTGSDDGDGLARQGDGGRSANQG